MRLNIVFASVVCLLLTCSVSLAENEKQQLEKLEQILSKVKKVTPKGWMADIELIRPKDSTRNIQVAIVIKSSQPIPVAYITNLSNFEEGTVIGLESEDVGEEKISPDQPKETVAIKFIVSKYLSPKEQKAVKKQNVVFEDRRLYFCPERMSKIKRRIGRDNPKHPSVFIPKTKEETALIRQYALLWNTTQPEALPTHHTDGISFIQHLRDWHRSVCGKKNKKEYAQIKEAVQKIIVPYEKKKKKGF